MEVKAKSILKALIFWSSIDAQEKILENDSLTMIKLIKKVWRVPWEIVEIMEEIRGKFQTKILSFSIF